MKKAIADRRRDMVRLEKLDLKNRAKELQWQKTQFYSNLNEFYKEFDPKFDSKKKKALEKIIFSPYYT